MKLAIMQPYFFPYIGYFQLINAVDKFVVYDDVNYIKRGWINRNRIFVNEQEYMFSMPLIKISQNKKINEIMIKDTDPWRSNLLKTIEFTYKKATYFKDTMPLIKDIISYPSANLSVFVVNCLKRVCNYLGIDTEIVQSSDIYNNDELKGQDRIIDICLKENADKYINMIGGMTLYNSSDFISHGIELRFLETKTIEYKQFSNEFISCLSIIDLLVFNNTNEIKKFLNLYELMK